MHYEVAEFQKNAFNCPICKAYAHMKWVHLLSNSSEYSYVWEAHCASCREASVWLARPEKNSSSVIAALSAFSSKGIMTYPSLSGAPMPSHDLPEECKADYLEARDIAARSPRGAAALLRLTLQKLCTHLGLPGKNINDDIKTLVRDRNLSEMVQQALDAIRVIGNNAVHPGELQLNDDEGTALMLFEMINIIVDEMITKPNKAKALFDRLPESAKAAIARRDQAQA